MISRRNILYIIVTMGGVAALSWEVLWQIKATLAMGVSAWGTAVLLAITMGGISVGTLIMGRVLKHKTPKNPLILYGLLETLIGLSGLCIGIEFHNVEVLDTWAYAQYPNYIQLIDVIGIAIAVGLPTMCMGASLPVLGLAARQGNTSLGVLYGLNTLGAAAGTLLAAFVLIPQLGFTQTAWAISAINILIGLSTLLVKTPAASAVADATKAIVAETRTSSIEFLVVFVTGFATLALEVAWFRSLTAAFNSTADAFAVMLAPVLLALGLSAQAVGIARKMKLNLGVLLAISGVLIIGITPLIERFDMISTNRGDGSPFTLIMNRFVLTTYILGAPIFFLGFAVPWLLDAQASPRRWGRLYAVNTIAAIAGSLITGWVFLPLIGATHTAWLIGALVSGTALIMMPQAQRVKFGCAALVALFVAVSFESGVGRTRVQGSLVYSYSSHPSKVLEYYEGPEATVSAIEYDNGGRALVVDGFMAAGQLGEDAHSHNHYMAWMGHVPMLLHPDPKNALVICFGTGQTSNAVRKENPRSLDIVDVNARVFKLGHNFASNENVLADPRVHTTVMDGRAFLRRTNKTFDILTLEPMPPNFAGVNALYDKEFYELARKRLSANGVIAQWVPFHLVAPPSVASIIRTFLESFPNAIMWMDPFSKTGILVGSMDAGRVLGNDWPGLLRTGGVRNMTDADIKNAVWFDNKHLRLYMPMGETVDDDNQLLAYGEGSYSAYRFRSLEQSNFILMKQIIGHSPSCTIGCDNPE